MRESGTLHRCGIISVAVGAIFLASCATETIVYHEVPEWQLREGVIPEDYIDADGVRHVNRPRDVHGLTLVNPEDPASASGRTTDAEGNAHYRALIPDQVLSATLELMIAEDYETLWNQVLSERTKREYEKSGGFEAFADFMTRNRNDLYTSLNRMAAEIRQPAVIIEPGPHGGQRVRLHRHFAREYKFSAIDTVWENDGMKLLMIHPTYAAE